MTKSDPMRRPGRKHRQAGEIRHADQAPQRALAFAKAVKDLQADVAGSTRSSARTAARSLSANPRAHAAQFVRCRKGASPR